MGKIKLITKITPPIAIALLSPKKSIDLNKAIEENIETNPNVKYFTNNSPDVFFSLFIIYLKIYVFHRLDLDRKSFSRHNPVVIETTPSRKR